MAYGTNPKLNSRHGLAVSQGSGVCPCSATLRVCLLFLPVPRHLSFMLSSATAERAVLSGAGRRRRWLGTEGRCQPLSPKKARSALPLMR